MKTQKTLSFDIEVAQALDSEDNQSAYVQDLIREDKDLDGGGDGG